MRDLQNEITEFTLAAGRETVTADGDGVDISDFKGNMKMVANYSAGGGASPTYDIKFQDSDDDITYADIPGATLTQITDGGASLQSLSIDTRAVGAFVRAVKTIGGGTPTFDGSIIGLGQKV